MAAGRPKLNLPVGTTIGKFSLIAYTDEYLKYPTTVQGKPYILSVRQLLWKCNDCGYTFKESIGNIRKHATTCEPCKRSTRMKEMEGKTIGGFNILKVVATKSLPLYKWKLKVMCKTCLVKQTVSGNHVMRFIKPYGTTSKKRKLPIKIRCKSCQQIEAERIRIKLEQSRLFPKKYALKKDTRVPKVEDLGTVFEYSLKQNNRSGGVVMNAAFLQKLFANAAHHKSTAVVLE